MKRLSLLAFVGLLSGVVGGCPVWNDDDHHHGGSSCFGDCSTGGQPGSCQGPSDCGFNETCGSDNQCHTGDCSIWGCSDGFSCVVDPVTQTASCEPGGAGGGGQGGGSDVIYCGNPDDCAAGNTCAPDGTCKPGDCAQNGCIYGYTCSADGSCKPSNPAACGTDGDCAGLGAGYACVSGICTQPSDQCFDKSQCAAGDKCVAGKCTPACTTSSDCGAGSGYACNTGLGICDKPVKTCTITNDCGGPKTVCVDGACVPRSAGAACPKGDVWVENGCIPSQTPNFTCKVDGTQDVCKSGSVCLHHSCYISCQADPSVCNNQPALNQCKPVTTSSGDHQVCGSQESLGGECDPTNPSKPCASGKICIDGFCK